MMRRVIEFLVPLIGLAVWYFIKDPEAAVAAGISGTALYLTNFLIEKWAGDRLPAKTPKAAPRSEAPPLRPRTDRKVTTGSASPARVAAPTPIERKIAVPREKSRRARPLVRRRTILFAGTSVAVGGVASWLIVEDKRDDSIRTFAGHTDVLFSVRFSPDSKTLATGSMDGTVRLWDVEASSTRKTLTVDGPIGGLGDIHFTPDGSTIMAGAGWAPGVGQQVVFWDARSDSPTRKFPIPGKRSRCAMSPDGRIVAEGGDQKVITLRVRRTWRPLGTLSGHTDVVSDITFSRDGKALASISADKTVRVWDVGTGKEIALTRDQEISSSGGQVSISPDGTLVAYTKGYHATNIWRPSAGAAVHAVTNGVHHFAGNPVFSPDRRHLACVDQWEGSHVIRIFDVGTGVEEKMLYGHESSIASLVYSPDGTKLASAGSDKTARLWSVG
ncbi:WD40 repeat domain-containing protein [Amycolatopsis sp. A133]|uniref:WD40 repeat domain-containing protein n=1 Tax=Amycolatopsis sp. A133 TaxID=3064472 RepID=UPI0027FEF359|nr:WD40 repeat domain-containing protein [Amycolatopsis sp. A133]MDQ7803121.1 WD40 repeat domain-containing protein [Amycolatopsis sp. A133]